MLQPRLCLSSGPSATLYRFAESLAALRVSNDAHTTTFCRYASHASQGRANGPKDSAGRRLGAKKTDSQFVIPGNIIFRQRGTKWFPGENVGMGKDHTIYATETGYVRYYRDPFRHKKRQFIGVALEREGPRSTLPTPPQAVTRRRLNMYSSPIRAPAAASDALWLESHAAPSSAPETNSDSPTEAAPQKQTNRFSPAPLPTRKKPMYDMQRESNWSIGRIAERKGITARKYDRSDRWLAWRKRNQKVKRSALLKAAKASRKGKANKGGVKRKVAKVTS